MQEIKEEDGSNLYTNHKVISNLNIIIDLILFDRMRVFLMENNR